MAYSVWGKVTDMSGQRGQFMNEGSFDKKRSGRPGDTVLRRVRPQKRRLRVASNIPEATQF